MNNRTVAFGILVLRVAMGAFFLNEARHQLEGGWLGGDGLQRMLTDALDHNTIPSPYRWFLEHTVLEHDQLFTVLTILGEVGVGTALILGMLTRLTCLVALSMNVNFLLFNDTQGRIVDAAFVVGELVLLAF